MKLNKTGKVFAGLCVGLASMFSPAPAISETSEPTSKKRTFNDSGVIGFEDWKCQGDYVALESMDEHIHRYGALDDLVNQEPTNDGSFWKSVRYHVEQDDGHTYISLDGTRNDGNRFSARREVLEYTYTFMRKSFDDLCDELNDKLTGDEEKCL